MMENTESSRGAARLAAAETGLTAGLKVEDFLEFAPDAILGIDRDGMVVLANKQAEAVFGWPREELLGVALEILLPERFKGVHPSHRDSYFVNPRTRPMGAGLELYGRRRDGSEFPAEISLSSIDTADGTLAVAAVRDISERKRAESRFEQFLEFAPDAIIGVDLSGAIVLVNQQVEALFDWPREELLGKPIETLVPQRYREMHRQHRAGYSANPVTRPMGADLDLFGLRRDGTEFPAEISLSSMDAAEGRIITAVVRDISERIEADREQRSLRAQLQHARTARLESIGQLAGGIAHDFNNMLAVILNYADFAKAELEDRPQVREDIDEISRAARQATDLTRQLLVFSRQEAAEPEPIDVNSVLQDMENMLRRSLGSHIELAPSYGPELARILGDSGEIEQVIVNLAVNARDAMPDGGALRIRTKNTELDEDYSSLYPDLEPGPYVEIAVEDEGEGMSPEAAARAFEPFYTTKEHGKGTGLGLATVYGIVNRAGGAVSIYSEPERGTTVKVYLPVTDQVPAAEAVPAAAPPSGAGETVLVVEDEEPVRRLTTRILTANGYEVIEADGAPKALELCGDPDLRFDLLLTDVIMPEMLGTELAKRVEELRGDVPILFMSGYMEPVGDAAHLRSRLIEKPFNANDLLLRVREALEERQ